MNTRDLTAAMAAEAGITAAAAEAALRAAIARLEHALVSGNRVLLPGFGSLVPVRRKRRRARHPGSGATIVIPARTTVKFVPAAALLGRLNADGPPPQ